MVAQLTTSNVYYQFMNFGTSYSQIRFGNSYSVSKNYLTLIPFVILICMLLFSTFTEKFGQKGKMLMFSGWLSFITCIMLYFYPADCGLLLIIPYTCFALWFSIYSSAMWPSIPLTVPQKMMGTAYGLINAANNIGLALYPFIFGAINQANTPEAYDNSIIGLLILSGLGIIGTTGAYICGKKFNNNSLDHLETQKAAIHELASQDGGDILTRFESSQNNNTQEPNTKNVKTQGPDNKGVMEKLIKTGSCDHL